MFFAPLHVNSRDSFHLKYSKLAPDLHLLDFLQYGCCLNICVQVPAEFILGEGTMRVQKGKTPDGHDGFGVKSQRYGE